MTDTPPDISAPSSFQSASSWSFDQPSARRSLILCAAGALLGLVIAGFGLFTAHGTRTAGVPAEDVALVNGVPILMSDYIQQVRTVFDVPLDHATPAQRRKALGDMIREELFVQRGVELGLQSDTVEVRTALVGGVEAQSAADATMSQPDEAELQAYYRQHVDQFSNEGVIDAVDRVAPAGADPAAITGALKQAVDTPAADRIAPRSGKATNGEEYYFAAKIHLGDALFAAARGVPSGGVSAPVRLPDAVHLVVVRKNAMPHPQPFADVRDQVLAGWVKDNAKRLTEANERFLRKRADIQFAPGFE